MSVSKDEVAVEEVLSEINFLISAILVLEPYIVSRISGIWSTKPW